MRLMTVEAAAHALEVSPRRVRQMLEHGDLVGHRVGRTWIIDEVGLERASRSRQPVGRPWAPASAWLTLALADDQPVTGSAPARSRARNRLLAEGLEGLAPKLASRAERRWFYAHPAVLRRMADDLALVRTGVSAAADVGADIVAVDEFDAYVRAHDLARVVDRLALDEHAERPNVCLQVVDDDVWPFGTDVRSAPRATVAVDLLQSSDPRTRRAGLTLARSL